MMRPSPATCKICLHIFAWDYPLLLGKLSDFDVNNQLLIMFQLTEAAHLFR